MNKDTNKDISVSVCIFTTILCIVLSLGLLFYTNTEKVAFAQSGSNASEFHAIRDQYLQSWENLNFQSVFDTYVTGGSIAAYGVYEERPSSRFAPGETLFLYVEPVGFTFTPSSGEIGSTLYSFDMSADIIISATDGIELERLEDLPVSKVKSHHKITERFLEVNLSQEEPFPKGNYVITYVVKDNPSGEIFEIVKEITIA